MAVSSCTLAVGAGLSNTACVKIKARGLAAATAGVGGVVLIDVAIWERGYSGWSKDASAALSLPPLAAP